MPEQTWVEWPIFEALFVRGVPANGPLQEALAAIGLNLSRPEPRYPSSVLDASLEVAARHLYPNLTMDQAQYELGLVAGSGFFATLVGQVMGAAMPLIGPDRVISTMPSRIKVGTSGGCTVAKLGEKRWRIELSGSGNPHFAAGNFVAALRMCKVKPTATVVASEPDRTVIEISW